MEENNEITPEMFNGLCEILEDSIGKKTPHFFVAVPPTGCPAVGSNLTRESTIMILEAILVDFKRLQKGDESHIENHEFPIGE